MQVTFETFWKCANKLLKKIFIKKGTEYEAQIVSALFGNIRYANGAKYVLIYTTLETERVE